MSATTLPPPAGTATAAAQHASPTAARPSRFRRWRRLLLVTALLGVVLWQAPVIVARTALRHQVLPFLFPEYAGRIETGGATLDWFAPIELRDVACYAPDEGRLLHAASIRSEKSLVALILDRPRAGHFYVTAPEVTLRLRDDGSNLEDAVAGMLSGDDSGELEFALDVTDGVVHVTDAEHGHQVRLTEVKFSLFQPLGPPDTLRMTAAGHVQPGDASDGQGEFAVELSIPPAGATPSDEPELARAKLEAENFPLQPFAPLLARALPVVRAEAELSCRITADWDPGPEAKFAQAESRVTLGSLSLQAPQWFGDDVFKSESVRYDGRIELRDGVVRCEANRLASDLGESEWACAVRLDDLSDGGAWQALAENDVRFRGTLNVAKLAAALPQTLRLRADTRLTAGTVRWNAASEPAEGGRRWEAEVEASGIEAERDGRRISWRFPLMASAAARRSPAGLVVDRIACRSDLLQLVGQGTGDAALVTAEGELEQVTRQLSDIIDLAGWRAAGRCAADLRLRRDGGESVVGTGRVRVDDLRIARAEGEPWEARQFLAEGRFTGRLDGQALRQIDEGSLTVAADADRCAVTLRGAIPLTESDPALAVRVEIQGDLDSWQTRLKPWAAPAGWSAAGPVRVSADAVLTPERVVVERSTLDAERLRLDGPWLHLNEPRAHVEAAGSLDWGAESASAERLTWTSPSLSLRADTVSADWSEAGETVASGTVVFRGGARELFDWFRDPRAERTLEVGGVVSGQARLQRNDIGGEAEWKLTVADLVARSNTDGAARGAGGVGWTERQFVASGKALYRPTTGQLELPDVRIESEALRLNLRGKVEDLAGRRVADLNGEVDADLSRLIEPLRGTVGDGLRFAGRAARPVALRGPLAGGDPAKAFWQSPELFAQAGVGWDSADVYGLKAGAATLDANLGDGVLRVSRLDLPVSEGRLTIEPHVELAGDAPTLVLDEGPLVEKVRLSPEMCRQWLRYVAPLLADATQIDGRVSASTAGARLPLTDFAEGAARGRLDIHGAQVRPGPRLDPLLQVVRQLKGVVDGRPAAAMGAGGGAWVTLPEQTVNVALADGRVQHATLELLVGDVTVRTSGSVGLDESLDLVAEIPVRDEWLAKNPQLGPLKGTILRIPIQGTVSRPSVDSRVLNDLLRQFAGNAAGRLLDEGVGRGLDRLFRRERP